MKTYQPNSDQLTFAPSKVENNQALDPISDRCIAEVTVTDPLSESSTFTADPIAKTESGRSFWRIFGSTFITIFLAEIGDKTQVSTLLMSAQFHNPWVVFLGAGSALVTTTLLGVLVGRWLSTRLSPRTLDIAAGILLALISLSLVWDVLQG